MGYALVRAALNAGADVTLISGPVNLSAPAKAKVISIETAQQMYEAVMERVAESEIYIGAAAVADYRPSAVQERKIKKQHDSSIIELQKNPDIIAAVAQLQSKPFTVGFAAETDNLEAYAAEKLRSKNLDMIAANWVGRDEGGFDSDNNALQVYWPGGQQTFALSDKQILAEQLINLIAGQFKAKN